MSQRTLHRFILIAVGWVLLGVEAQTDQWQFAIAAFGLFVVTTVDAFLVRGDAA